MFIFKSKNKNSSLMEQAKRNLSKRAIRVAKQLIKLVDEDLLNNTEKGYGYGSIYHQRYDVKVDKEVLDYMKEHYEKQGFEVEVDYPSNDNNRFKSFTIRCD